MSYPALRKDTQELRTSDAGQAKRNLMATCPVDFFYLVKPLATFAFTDAYILKFFNIFIRAESIQILSILQVPSTAVNCIHKYKYQSYQYMQNV